MLEPHPSTALMRTRDPKGLSENDKNCSHAHEPLEKIRNISVKFLIARLPCARWRLRLRQTLVIACVYFSILLAEWNVAIGYSVICYKGQVCRMHFSGANTKWGILPFGFSQWPITEEVKKDSPMGSPFLQISLFFCHSDSRKHFLNIFIL